MAEDRPRELHDLVKDIGVAMMTTRRADGRLVARPMQKQEDMPGADFWFVTERDSEKVDELEYDPHVNLAFYKDGTKEWVSVSGTAFLSDDRDKIHELYRPDWKAWFGDEGGAHDGGPDDPRMLLIGIRAESAAYLDVDKPKPLAVFDVLKGMAAGQRADVGRTKPVEGDEIRRYWKTER